MSESPDGLFETSESALRQRLARFKQRMDDLVAQAPKSPLMIESPVERAMMGLACAVEELNQAIIFANTPEALTEMRDAAEDAITRLCVVSSVTLTLAEYFGEQS